MKKMPIDPWPLPKAVQDLVPIKFAFTIMIYGDFPFAEPRRLQIDFIFLLYSIEFSSKFLRFLILGNIFEKMSYLNELLSCNTLTL